MHKYVDADEAYEILDKFFVAIQKKRYKASQKMIDEIWSKWTKLPNALNLKELDTRIRDKLDDNMMISYSDLSKIIADEAENCSKRTCKFCGKSRKETVVFPIHLNGEDIYACEECLSNQKDVTNIGFNYLLEDEINFNANKRITLYVHFKKPELFGNASYAKISYMYENEVELKHWHMHAKIDFISKALGLQETGVMNIIKVGETHPEFERVMDCYDSIEFCTKEEYDSEN